MERGRIGLLALSISGLIAWAAQFTVIYGATSMLCERGWTDVWLAGVNIVPLVVAGTTVLALAATGGILWLSLSRSRRTGSQAAAADRFLNDLTTVVSGIALVSILWQGLPGLLVPPCV